MDLQRYHNLTQYLTDWTYPPNTTPEEQRKTRGQAQRFLTKNNILYRKNKNNLSLPLRVVKPDEVHNLIQRLHQDPLSGHLGIENTFQRAQQRYYWPQMFEDIRKAIQHCDTCQRRGKPHNKEALHPLQVSTPFSRVGIDLLQLPLTTKGNRQVIVATDYLTKWVEARALPDKSAASVAGFIYEDIICRHGAPKELLSDQGTEFLNQLVQEICRTFEVKRRVTTPYHPQTNGLTERFNRTLINLLRKLTYQHEDFE